MKTSITYYYTVGELKEYLTDHKQNCKLTHRYCTENKVTDKVISVGCHENKPKTHIINIYKSQTGHK